MSVVKLEQLSLGAGQPLALIAGPCVAESEDLLLTTAAALVELTQRHGVGLVFKSSYEKDNRTVPEAFRGPGLEAGLASLAAVKARFGCPVLTDVHRTSDVALAAEVVDILQVPALLCRQTSLLEAVGRAGCAVNVKKGPFMSPRAMAGAVAKVRGAGGTRVMLTERGTTFGYDRLVCDVTAVPDMQALGVPVVFDAGHASNAPSEIQTLACAGVAAGADAIYIECHPDPANALSDDKRMLSLRQLDGLLPKLVRIAHTLRA